MPRRLSALALAAAALVLTGVVDQTSSWRQRARERSGEQTEARLPSDSRLAVEVERLARHALGLAVERAIRLLRVAEPIRREGAALCGERLGPLFGWVVSSREELPDALLAPARERFGMREGVTVLGLLPESSAARAGVREGDVIVRLDGRDVRRPAQARSLKRFSTEPIPLQIRRAGELVPFELEYIPGCLDPADLAFGDSPSAFADGKQVVVSTGMIRFLDSDDDLALVLGHELAHNLLEHEGSIAARERDADYLGAYLAARAGFDVSRAPELWYRFGLLHAASVAVRRDSSHPSSAARSVALGRTLREIHDKRDRGQPLEPEYLR